MAKGDSDRSQNMINQQGQIAQYGTGGENQGLTGIQNQFKQQYQATLPQYQQSMQNAQNDYSNIMSGYQNFQNSIGQNNPLAGLNYGNNAGLINQDQVNSAMQGYQNFANTGGFTPQNLGAMQQASMAPIRSAYNQAQNTLQQGQGLAGGYSPNLAAAQAQMARQQGQTMSQQEIASQANIANLVQQGKLAGLGGLSQTALQNQAEGLQAAAINNQYNLGLGGLNLQNQQIQNQARLGALQGQQGMYSATPGQANMLQNYLMGMQQLQLGGQGLQNQLSLGLMNAQNQKANIPGNFAQGIQNATGLANLLGKLGSGLGGLSGGPGGGTGTNSYPGGGSANNYYGYGNPNYTPPNVGDPNYPLGGGPDDSSIYTDMNPGLGGNYPGSDFGSNTDMNPYGSGGYYGGDIYGGGGGYYDDGETNWGG